MRLPTQCKAVKPHGSDESDSNCQHYEGCGLLGSSTKISNKESDSMPIFMIIMIKLCLCNINKSMTNKHQINKHEPSSTKSDTTAWKNKMCIS